MNLLPLVIQLIAGAVGGNVAGAVLKDKSLGALGNTIAGIRSEERRVGKECRL